jgi:cytochrome bd ubiquinol oxidase subunit II
MLARAAEVAPLLLGWELTQLPYLIYTDMTFEAAAAPPAILRFVLWSLVPGGLLLIPSLWLLFAVFKP